jgi:hypothetical protein
MKIAPMTITGNGVFHVKSSDIVRSDEGIKQLEALKLLRKTLREEKKI